MIQKKALVTSAGKMKDTITVTTHQRVSHPLYKKSYRVSKKFLVDTNNVADIAVGDEVLIQECRPLSKRKYFKLLEVLKRVPRVSEMVDQADTASDKYGKKSKEEETDSTPAA